MWERACSRKRCVSHCKCRLKHCFREQARSHFFVLCYWFNPRCDSSGYACAHCASGESTA
ncbi:hypothetical protein C3E98_019960 [Pseudomonas sp. MWU13-2625]|nr:hypothetical protein C3E98_019960 [Pseudomonas sp. MWU13-2625]